MSVGNQAVERLPVQGQIYLGHSENNPAAGADAFDDSVDVACGFGVLNDFIQGGFELEEGAKRLDVLEPLARAAQFFFQVFLMAKEGGDGEAVDSAEGLKGMGPGQEGQVDGLALGMVTGFTFHGLLRNQGPDNSGQWSEIRLKNGFRLI